MELKVCKNCKLEKNVSEFYLSKSEGKPKYSCKACCIAKATQRYWSAPQSKRDKQKQRYLLDANRAKESARKWRINNLERDRLNKKTYHGIKMSTDPLYKLKHNIRIRLRKAIKYQHKGGSAIKDLGCSVSEFKAYLESKFQPGMSWDNYGKNGWHIDHIVPLSKYNLYDPEELKKACHYTNLQPLWEIDNLRKGDKHGT